MCRCLHFFLALTLIGGVYAGSAEARSLELRLDAESIHDPELPLGVEIDLPHEARQVSLQILRPCEGRRAGRDLGPGPPGAECAPPLETRPLVVPPRPGDSISTKLMLRELGDLPRDHPLWLRALVVTATGTDYQDAIFRVDSEQCASSRSFFAKFLPGKRCWPSVISVLAGHWAEDDGFVSGPIGWLRFAAKRYEPTSLGDGVFFVSDGDVGGEGWIPDSEGTTGLAWIDEEHLVATRMPDASRLLRAVDGLPGLFRFSFSEEGVDGERLWSAAEGQRPVAPCALGDGRLVFITYAHSEPGSREAARLHVWSPNSHRTLSAPLGVDRCLVASPDGRAVLLVTRDADGPGFVEVDLATGEQTEHEWSDAVFLAALHTAVGGGSVIALEDLENNEGWNLRLEGESGSKVLTEDGARLPALSPGGAIVAYVEVEID